jgi:hypothetical protein
VTDLPVIQMTPNPGEFLYRRVTLTCPHMHDAFVEHIPEILYRHPRHRSRWFRVYLEAVRDALRDERLCECGQEALTRWTEAGFCATDEKWRMFEAEHD